MNAVIIGGRDRTDPKDRDLVFELLGALEVKYSNLLVISSACDKGVGAFVKERCLSQKTRPNFSFCEVSIDIYGRLPRTKLVEIYASKNETLLRIGEEFHCFPTANRRSGVEELITRAAALGREVHIYPVGLQTVGFSGVGTKPQPVMSSEVLDLLKDGD